MRLNPILHFLARLGLALCLLAPHAAPAAGGGGLTLVICGAEGAYTLRLSDDAPVDAAERAHDCCLICGPLAPPPAGATAAPPPGPQSAQPDQRRATCRRPACAFAEPRAPPSLV